MADKNKNPKPNKPIILLILDGWGVAARGESNAISQALTPTYDGLVNDYPAAVLTSSGPVVGLKPKEPGNCEIGHLAIGLGRKDSRPRSEYHASMGIILAKTGVEQTYIAETEKFSHLSYFLNGGNQIPSTRQILIPTPITPSYAKTPAMASSEVAKEINRRLLSGEADFIVANFAGPDLLGLTGNKEATVKAIEAVDTQLAKIVKNGLNKKAIILITADHGNVEDMQYNNTGRTTNPVPFIVVAEKYAGRSLGWPDVIDSDLSIVNPIGSLLDVAPTVLHLFGLEIPSIMTGQSLIKE